MRPTWPGHFCLQRVVLGQVLAQRNDSCAQLLADSGKFGFKFGNGFLARHRQLARGGGTGRERRRQFAQRRGKLLFDFRQFAFMAVILLRSVK